MATDYVPIDCGVHDHLELHAMRGDVLHVEYVTPAGRTRTLADVRLVTLRSQAGEEIGVFRSGSGGETRVRLDRLRTVEDRRTGRSIRLLPSRCAGAEGPRPEAGAAS